MTASWGGEHPQDLLAAYGDGELGVAERMAVAAHLTGCRACRAEVSDALEIRALVRSLPNVEPPEGFYERVLAAGPAPRGRVHRRARAAAVNLVAAGALWIGVLGVLGVRDGTSITPDLRSLLGQHTTLATVGSAATAPVPVAAPRSLSGDYVLVRAMTVDGWPQYLYEDAEGRTLSVFARPGRLREEALPATKRAVAVNGVSGWAVTIDEQEVVFLQKPGSVVVLVGDDPRDATADAAMEPILERRDDLGIVDQLVGAGRALLETFGLAA